MSEWKGPSTGAAMHVMELTCSLIPCQATHVELTFHHFASSSTPDDMHEVETLHLARDVCATDAP